MLRPSSILLVASFTSLLVCGPEAKDAPAVESEAEPAAPAKPAPPREQPPADTPTPTPSGASTDAIAGFAALIPPPPSKPEAPTLESFRERDYPDYDFEGRVAVEKAGWTADGSEFAVCFEVAGCLGCTFRKPGGEEEMLSHVFDDCDPDESKAVAERLAAGGYDRRGEWSQPSTIFIEVQIAKGEDDERDFELVVGHEFGQRRGPAASFEAYGAFPIPEDLVLSPDGETLALVMQDFMGLEDGYPAFDFHVEFIPAKQLLRKAFDVAGFDALGRADWDEALEAFARAAAIDPSAWKPPFNMACAAARAGQADTAKLALSEAIRRGGDEARKSARKDKDLESLRSLAWFDELVGE